MNSLLKFDFTVDKEKKAVHVQREFAAPRDLVWAAWTTPEILDQWWAPKPYKTVTKTMDFRVGGHWFYAMISPENVAHWCRADYQSIDTLESFSGLDAFCDEQGNINNDFPRSLWNNRFTDSGEKTLVNITVQYEKLEDLEQIIAMGFKEGFTMAMENLDQYIESQFKLRHENKTTNKARVCTYLNFDGKTEEAFLFYQSVFKTKFIGKGIQRFGELPADANHPPVADDVKNMVLHVELPITGNHVLMGTDAPKEMGFNLARGNNMHICIEPESRDKAKRLYEALSANGQVNMPLQDIFWGAYYAEFTDQFGINWMINFQNANFINKHND
ncbi:SRPBCC domain-containing protein [Flavobacterium sp. CYK-55]|uniref:SRPBCC domain-containing protein n=1 Tax=Flavobacterium sp. CYK-55 TaxID=2835529 RepID=UPI001BD0A96E|nr:SRPBCC domain-containing protein [Flavobacterium sp. CYK-55]MBS7788181.1 SRPBCC domain-containing protein [Flavobacterium sp. CYK-55]